MSIQTRLLLFIGSILLLSFVSLSYIQYQYATQNAQAALFEQASKVRNVLMAYRHVGQKVFINEKLPLTDKNLGLLPAFAMGQMAKVYSRWDKSGFSFNNVSDQPRNPEHQADKMELEVMDYFRKNEGEDTVFKPFINQQGEKYYLYARPIWIKKQCLHCHAKPEDAPETIRKKYTTAFYYQMGDLRGLLSIKMPATAIEQAAWDNFYSMAKIQLLSIAIIFFLIMFFIRTSILKPLSMLSTVMKNVSNGDYSQRISGLSGEFSYMQTIFNDMGQQLQKNQKELELQVEQRTRQLSLTNDELSSTLKNLQLTQQQLVETEKMASLGGLVAGVAHEINTPIGVGVTASTHLNALNKELQYKLETNNLKKSDLANYIRDSQEAGYIILTNLNRAAQLIKSFKQIAVDQTYDNHRIIDVHSYIDDCLLSLKPLLKIAQHQVDIHCLNNIKINCNPGEFSQVITNLFINSIKHAYDPGQSGHIQLKFEQKANTAYFHYSDDGKGIKKEHINKIFEPFFTTSRNEGGSGLGLSTVYNIITHNMSGSIHCISEAGQGTHFYFELACEAK